MVSANQPQSHIDQLLQNAIGAYQSQDINQACNYLDQALKIMPKHPDALNLRGTMAYVQQDYKSAIKYQKQAVALDPNFAGFRNNYGVSLRKAGSFDEAAAQFLAAIRLLPNDAMAYGNIGRMLYEDQNNFEKAVPYLQHALKIQPQNNAYVRALGACYIAMNKWQDALPLFLAAENGAGDGDSDLFEAIALCYYFNGEIDLAIIYAEKALNLNDKAAKAHFVNGCSLLMRGRVEDAISALRFALQIEPANFDVRHRLADALLINGDYTGAAQAIDPWLRDKDILDNAVAAAVYTKYLINTGKYNDLISFGNLLRKDLKDVTHFFAVDLSLSGLVLAEDEATSRRLFEIQKMWGDSWRGRVKKTFADPAVRFKGAPRKIGLLSSDFRDHSVGKFLMPLINGVDRSQIEFYAYSLMPGQNDRVYEQFRKTAPKFVDLDGSNPALVAEKIAKDQVDILIDLNGMTLGSCTQALAWRAAPVQMSWLGYPFTTGILECDYLVVDKYLNPDAADCMVEKPLVLDGVSYLCFGANVPRPIGDSPRLRNGYITFGSLNSPYKLGGRTVELWRNVLLAVPDSKLLYVRQDFKDQNLVNNLVSAIAGGDIDPARLSLRPNYHQNHLDHYNDIDISLDTYPVTGGTTTLESLWMGVPVVSRMGKQIHQRVSHSILNFANLSDLSAASDEAYTAIAAELAQNHERLVGMRKNFRDTLIQTPLMDIDKFIGGFTRTLLSV